MPAAANRRETTDEEEHVQRDCADRPVTIAAGSEADAGNSPYVDIAPLPLRHGKIVPN